MTTRYTESPKLIPSASYNSYITYNSDTNAPPKAYHREEGKKKNEISWSKHPEWLQEKKPLQEYLEW